MSQDRIKLSNKLNASPLFFKWPSFPRVNLILQSMKRIDAGGDFISAHSTCCVLSPAFLRAAEDLCG